MHNIQHALIWDMDSAIIWDAFCYYLECFHFMVPCDQSGTPFLKMTLIYVVVDVYCDCRPRLGLPQQFQVLIDNRDPALQCDGSLHKKSIKLQWTIIQKGVQQSFSNNNPCTPDFKIHPN